MFAGAIFRLEELLFNGVGVFTASVVVGGEGGGGSIGSGIGLVYAGDCVFVCFGVSHSIKSEYYPGNDRLLPSSLGRVRERKKDYPKCAVSWDRVGNIAPSRPHSRVGIIVVVWGRIYDTYSRETQCIQSGWSIIPVQKTQNPSNSESEYYPANILKIAFNLGQ